MTSRAEQQRALRERLRSKKLLQKMVPLLDLEREIHGLILDELKEGRDAALQMTLDILKITHNRMVEKMLAGMLKVQVPEPPAEPAS